MELNTFNIIQYLVLGIGMILFFRKCKIDLKWAFVPGYRLYKLGEYVELDEEGVVLMNVVIFMEIVRAGSWFFELRMDSHYHSMIMVVIIQMVCLIVQLIYSFRIGTVLYGNMKGKHKHRIFWPLMFAIFQGFTLLLWGVLPNFSIKEKQEEMETAAELYDSEQEILKKGLTINLAERSVKQHLKKRYLLRDIHMNITPNKMVLLLGGSGAGKTTFLNAITGYEKANAVISLNGEDVYKNFNHMKYKIGFVPQQDLIRYEDTVQKTLLDAATLRLPTEYSRKEKQKRVKEVLEIFGLTPVRDNLVTKGSGGQKKRISIATEFISDPSLFILDEPDSGLDGILARELMQRLHDISRQERIVIVITHTPDRVIDLFDEVIVLGKDANRTGRLVYHGSIDDAREFFQVEKMEEIIRKINCVDEGGEGMTDELIERFEGVRHGK